MIFMCVCARPGQSFRCKHALRETRQQPSILPRNQIYSAAANYFRPHCSRNLLIARARQNLRTAKVVVSNILHSQSVYAIEYMRIALNTTRIDTDLYVCLIVSSSHLLDSYLLWQYCNVTLLSLVRLGLYYKMYMNNISV